MHYHLYLISIVCLSFTISDNGYFFLRLTVAQSKEKEEAEVNYSPTRPALDLFCPAVAFELRASVAPQNACCTVSLEARAASPSCPNGASLSFITS